MRLWNSRRVLALLSAGGLALLALVAGGVYFVASPDFEQMAADYTLRTVRDRTGAIPSLEAFRIDFWGQRVEIFGLELRGEEDPLGEPLLRVESIEIGFGLRSLLQRRIDLWSLQVRRPEIYLRVGEDGKTNVPSPPAPDPGGRPLPLELAIGDFVLSEGSLRINENRVDIDFELADVEGLFNWAEDDRMLSGHLRYQGAIEGLGAGVIPYGLDTEFDYLSGAVVLGPTALVSGETRLSLEGRIREFFGDWAGSLRYDGTVDLPFLNHFLPSTRLSGLSDVGGELEFTTSEFRTSGHASSERLEVAGWVATDFESDFTYAYPGSRLEATDLRTGFAGGAATGAVAIEPLPGSPAIHVDLGFSGVDPVVFGEYFSWGVEYVEGSAARGTLAGWVLPGPDDFDLSGSLALSRAGSGSRGGVTGNTRFHARPGFLELEGLNGALGATRAVANGTITDSVLDLTTTLESEDLADLGFLYPAANGAGRFSGRVFGSLDEPEAEGEFSLSGVVYDGREIDSIDGNITVEADRVELDAVRVRTSGSEFEVAGTVGRDGTRPDLDVTLLRLDAVEIQSVIEQPVEGDFTGRIRLTGFDPVEFAGEIAARGLAYDGHLLGNGDGQVVYGPTLIAVSDASVRRAGEQASGTFRYEPGQELVELDLVFSGHRMADYRWIGIPDPLEGTVRDGEISVRGARARPRIEGRVELDGFRVGRQAFPTASIRLETSGPLLHAVVETDRGLDVSADIEIETEGLPFSGEGSFRAFDIGELAGLDAGAAAATGEVAFTGQLTDLATLEGQGTVTSLSALFEGQALEVTRPFPFAFNTRQVDVQRLELTSGEAAPLELSGTIAIERDAPLDLSVFGPIDLSVLENRYPGLEAGGTVQLEAWIEGTVADPLLGGVAILTDVSLGHDSAFLGVSGLRGDVFLDGPRASLTGLRGRIGGGDIVLNGTFGVSGAARGAMDIRADVTNVRPGRLRGMRTAFDGAFGLRGSLEAPVLEGNVQLRSLSFGESFEEFMRLFDTGPEPEESGGPLDAMALAIHVEGDRNIRVENELASLDSRVDLDVGGTWGSPSLTGHAEISRGTLELQGRRYRITRGNVDFVDPIGIDPRIDIQAEADIRDYRIIILITGRGDDLQFLMRSDPALPQLEIVSLIAGGKTLEELRREREELGAAPGVGTAAATEEQLFQGAASNILADMLRSRVGSRLGILNSVRIDPFQVGADSDPVARLTISEQITSDLEITYSQDLSSNTQQIIQIEYFLNGDTSFVASRDEAGRLGLDIKLRKRFD